MPDAVWRALDGCETVLHAGDFDSWETYCEFKKRFPVFGVIGNRDSFGVSEEVPERRIVELGSFRIGMTHGSGPRAGLPARVRAAWSGAADLVVFGHSHEVGIHEINGLRLLNPGSATDVCTADRQTLAYLDLEDTIRITIHEISL